MLVVENEYNVITNERDAGWAYGRHLSACINFNLAETGRVYSFRLISGEKRNDQRLKRLKSHINTEWMEWDQQKCFE